MSSASAGASASASASASIGSEATHTIDIKAPLWDHVTILEKAKTGGGNTLWRCNYCTMEKLMGCFPYDLVDKSWTICSLIDEFGHEIA